MAIQEFNQNLVDNNIEITIMEYIAQVNEHLYGIDTKELMETSNDTDEESACENSLLKDFIKHYNDYQCLRIKQKLDKINSNKIKKILSK